MMTLYALLLFLFSLPASAWEPETYDAVDLLEFGATAIEQTAPVLPKYDYATVNSMDSDEHIATVTSPAGNPLADVSIDPTFDFVADDFTAAVTSPIAKPITDAPIDTTVDWFADDEGWDFNLPPAIDHSIRASDWW